MVFLGIRSHQIHQMDSRHIGFSYMGINGIDTLVGFLANRSNSNLGAQPIERSAQ